MQYTTETIERKVEGPFVGKRSPSMSDDVVHALLTVEYRFEDFTIIVIDIPARWDRSTGAEYVTGKISHEVSERVTEVAAMIERQRQRSKDFRSPEDDRIYQAKGRLNRAQIIADILQVTPLRLSLNLPNAA